MSDKTVKALCFDVFGTVTDWYSSVAAEGEALSAELGIDVPWGEFVTKWRIDGYFAALFKIATGEMDYIPTEEIHRRKLRLLVEEYGLSGLSDEQFEHFNLAWSRIKAWPDAAEGLTMMKRDFMIMPLSNGEYRPMLDIGKRNGLPWDGIISADFFDSVKPDPVVYKGAAKMLELDPAEIMMVACHAQDLMAAKKCGFRTAYVNRPLEYGPGVPQEEKQEPFDYDADDFIELAKILRSAKADGEI